MTTRPRRIEVITGPERRRRWSPEEKRAIVAESYRPDTSPSAVARRHGLNTGQLYTWRHQLSTSRAGGFAHVDLTDAPPAVRSPARIEIILVDGTIVRVDDRVDGETLRRVLAMLRG